VHFVKAAADHGFPDIQNALAETFMIPETALQSTVDETFQHSPSVLLYLYNRLLSRITEYLMNEDEPGILKYFTERRLRPLTLLASDADKLREFDEMKKALCIFN
jgi:hypothetical protein